MFKIYKITSLIDNKVYVGQTKRTLKDRFNAHMWGASEKNVNTKMVKHIRKYGKENFIIEEIESLESQEECDKREVFWINHFNSHKHGLNMKNSIGKCGGDTLSDHENMQEISSKIRESKLGDKNPMKNKENSKKISGEKNGMYGRTGSKNPWSKKAVVLYEDKTLYKTYECITDIKKEFNIPSLSMVSSRCRGKTKSPYKGFYFMFLDDYLKVEKCRD